MTQLDYARWVLERNLHWIAVVEVKTAVILSVDTAMLGALVVAFSALDPSERTAWGILWGLVAAFSLCVSICQGALAVWPQTDGPPESLIFFGRIKAMSAETYRRQFLGADEASQLDDCLAQIHRNAEIASKKFGHVTLSMKIAFVSLPFWVIAISKLIADNR